MLPSAADVGRLTQIEPEARANRAEAIELDAADSGDPALAVIHTGRRVPIYRKLGEFSSKRVREIMHAVLALLPDAAIPETLPAELLRRRKLISRADGVASNSFSSRRHAARALRPGAKSRASAPHF